MSELLTGFAVALTPSNLLWGLAGTTLGTAVGVLPGIGPALTVALLLPVTYNLDPTAALIMFAGIYYGAMYGGSTTSILLNTPGESATIVTAIDGHQMARNGRAGAALATSAIGSFVAGTLATLALSVTAPLMVKFALAFGSAEYFALMVVAFVMVTTMLGESRVKGWLSLLLGLTLGFVGIDGLSGRARLSFGIPYLLDGIDPVIVAIGLFAVGETLWVASRGPAIEELLPVRGSLWMTKAEWSRSWKPWLRGTAIGFPLGALPAGGAELPTLMSYAIEKRLSKRPEEFGRGAIEAVAGPEAANNASAAGTLVPLFTLGLPTSATAAVLLAAFQQFGLQPDPLLFEHEPALVWGVIASLYIGNVMLLVLNLPLVGVWVKLLSIPRPWLYGGILVVASLGAFSVHRAAGDLVLMAAIGIVGFVLRLIEAPVAPVMIGLILGPAAEQHLRRALSISQGDWTVFVTHPLSAGLLLAAIAIAGFGLLRKPPAGLSTVARSAKADIEIKAMKLSELFGGSDAAPADQFPDPAIDIPPDPTGTPQSVVLGGGCFWCTEAVFVKLDGVIGVMSGYAGGTADTADYRSVCSGTTDHAEVIRVRFDSGRISFGQILKVFFAIAHDPTHLNRQGNDIGRQYRSAIFYADDDQRRVSEAYIKQLSDAKVFPSPIVTTLEPLEQFFEAEDYHQDFVARDPNQPYISAVALPKVKKLEKAFGDKLKKAT